MTRLANPAIPKQLPGYTIVETIYQGTCTTVYRALATANQQPVVIKVLSQDYPSFGDLVQFRNQYTIAKSLSSPGIVRSLNLEPYGNGYALVMEDGGGVDLGQYLQHNALSVTDILDIAIQLAQILHELHQERVIHKDLKPANILIHPKSKQVTLIDFSIASLLPKETQTIQSPKSLEGTLAYLAPEQTGRMNRAIDYRTDFYALGVTLYELLTGQLPFISDDPLELLHCHMAQLPKIVNQVNPEVPAIVGAIVAKLMAKNAEDRYQSALGLKHDLEQCLKQWKEQGKIAEFNLGERDLSDRFLIPEKLYGRETEVQILLDAFERVASPPTLLGKGGRAEMLLVAGFSGIGKTAVINEVHQPITQHKGYFIKGKFDQFNRNIPFSAFVQAFQDLVGQLLSENDAELEARKAQILDALGENAQVIIDLIPELKQILGPQPPVSELSGTAAQNRFNLLFQKFIQVFTTPAHPLVIFVDDWQWADSASLKLLQVLMAEGQTGYLLLLGAYRDNEVSPAHPFILALEELKQAKATIQTITLTPLTFADTCQLVEDTFHCSTQRSQSITQLTELIVRSTQGNPFFTTQFLKTLHQEGYLTFNHDHQEWDCDLAQVSQLMLADDVVMFMCQQLQKLPQPTQQVLTLAACIGSQFDLSTLAIISEQPQTQVASALWFALQEGLILPTSPVYQVIQAAETAPPILDAAVQQTYRFLHDRIQQAAYALIPAAQQQQTHLQIGRLLWQKTQEADYLFEILSHLNRGMGLIIDPQERQKLMRLNLAGCQRSKLATAYSSALQYAEVAMALLPDNPWSTAHETDYDFVLSLYETTAEVAYLSTDFKRAEALSQSILAAARSVIDRIKAYELLVQIYIAEDQQSQAIETGLSALAELGVPLAAQSDWQSHLPSLPDAATLAQQPIMDNPAYLAALRILIAITPPTHHVKPELFPAVVLTMVKLCDREGLSSFAAYAYGIYGLLLSGLVDNSETAYCSGQLSLQLLEQFQANALRTKVNMLFAVFVCACKDSGKVTLPLLKQGIEVGFEVGDIEYASYCIMAYFSNLFLVGQPLGEIEEFRKTYISALEQFKQLHCIEYSKIWFRFADSFVSQSLPINSTPALVADFEATHNHQCLFAVHLSQLITNYTFGQYDQALEHGTQALTSQEAAFGILLNAAHSFYYALAFLAQLSPSEMLEQTVRQPWPEQVDAHREKLSQLASHAPDNYQHKVDLIVAEQCRVVGQPWKALEHYDCAIAGAKQAGYIQEQALANELAAKFYLSLGKEKVAAGYMQDAYYCYACWGAKAKIADLETRYPELLQPILKPSASQGDMLTTLMSVTPLTPSVHRSAHNSSSHTNLNQALDFASLLKASQTLSGIIQLDELLHQLTQIILQNSGGDRCALILPDEVGDWQVKAIATPEETQLCAEPLAHHPRLPLKLIQYVKNSQETVVIDALETELPVIDDYLRQRSHKSILCLPLLNQGNLIGILYLRNHLTTGVFTEERILVLDFLCTQAVISLENARLYQLEQKKAQEIAQRESEYRSIFENVNDGLTLADLTTGQIVAVNPKICQMHGYTQQEFSTLQPSDFIHASYVHEFANFIEVLNQGEEFYAQVVALHKDGHSFDVEVKAVPFIYQGKPHGLSVVRDISDRKKADNALRESEAKYRNLLSNLDGVVYRCLNEKGWAMEFVGDAITNLSGYPISDFIDSQVRTYASIIHPDDLPLVEEIVDHSLEHHQTFVLEYRIMHRDGSIRWVTETGKGICNDAGELSHIEGVILDINDRKAAEAALTESEAYHRNLFEQSAIGFILCRMNGEFVHGNQALADIIGRDKEEIPFLTYWELTPEKYAEAEQVQLESLNRTGRYGPYEKEYIHKDGHLVPIRLSGVIVERHGEKFIWSSVEEISDRKQAEDAVLQKSHDLETALIELQQTQLQLVQNEKMSALGGLVSGVAHEINNPVGCILGNVNATQDYVSDLLGLLDRYAEQFPEPGPDIEDELETVDLEFVRQDLPQLIRAMKDSGDRIKDISRSLRTFSRADTESKQPFEIHTGIESTVLILRHRLKGNENRPTIEVIENHDKLPEVSCFPGQLNQVFMNILANAIDMFDEMALNISFKDLKNSPQKITIQTAYLAEQNQVEIRIADNGKGIPDEVKSRIFDHLFTTKGVGKGTGLGLAIARQIVVDVHHGSLDVQSALGQGTEFCIRLPL